MAKSTKNSEQQFDKMNKENKKEQKGKWKFKGVILFFVVFSFFTTIILFLVGNNDKEKMVERYLEVTDSQTLNTIYDNNRTRGDAAALVWYEQNMLGISNNTALAGVSWNCDVNKNNKNVIGDIIALRDSNTSGLKVTISGETVYSGEDSVGEIIATKESVYFIDETDNNSIHIYNIDTGEEKKLIDDSVCQFALYGNYIFYLNDEEKIIRYSLKTEEVKDVVNNVQRFYLTDNLVVQNGTNIVYVKLDGSSYTTLVSNALLVGADSEHVYYINFGISVDAINTKEVEENFEKDIIEKATIDKEIKGNYVLFAINLSTKENIAIEGRDSLIRAVYVTEKGICIDTVE